MSKQKIRPPAGKNDTVSRSRHHSRWRPKLSLVRGLVFVLGLLGIWILKPNKSKFPAPESSATNEYHAHAAGTLAFTKDIAPIIFKNCSGCHRPGQSGPFPLLTFVDVKKHAKEISDVTARRFMPPWPPQHGYGEFADERRLADNDLGILQQWIREGSAEGDQAFLPPLPHWTEGWQLGQPDLVVKLTQPYSLPAEGTDIYRNFVVPIPTDALKYVKGVEFLPGNAKVLHHSFINIDETRQSRRLAQQQTPPGFDGMDLPESAIMPGGQLLGWQPGKVPSFVAEGLSWILRTNTDLVLQMHLHPSGKTETVDPSVGFYFTDKPPESVPFRIKLARYDFEIPKGADNYTVEGSYLLPVDVQLLRALPHAHYLGKDLQGYAMLPSGEKRWLIRIPDWDFNWQGDYGYAQPISLPKGARLVMRYIYDNSTNNTRNPNRPPKNVAQGLQTTDEMAGLVFQAVTKTPEDRLTLAQDYFNYITGLSVDYCRFLLDRNPADVKSHVKLGRTLAMRGETTEGINHLQAALATNPESDPAHYELGYIYLGQKRFEEAFQEFRTVVRINPKDYQAFGNLGYILTKAGKFEEAKACFVNALRLNPDDNAARQSLESLKARR